MDEYDDCEWPVPPEGPGVPREGAKPCPTCNNTGMVYTYLFYDCPCCDEGWVYPGFYGYTEEEALRCQATMERMRNPLGGNDAR